MWLLQVPEAVEVTGRADFLVRQAATARRRLVAALWAMATLHQRRTYIKAWRELEVPGAPVLVALRLARDGWLPFESPAGIDRFDWDEIRERCAKAWRAWANRARNVDRCGKDYQVYSCKGCRKEFAFEKTCRSRYCADCVPDIRQRTIERVHDLVEKYFRHRPRFLTLTRRNSRELAGTTSQLTKAFAKLRGFKRLFRTPHGRWRGWRDLVLGGVYAIEITEDLGRRDDAPWHPHLHVLLDSLGFLPWSWLCEGWQRANGCRCPRSHDRTRPVLCRHSTWRDGTGRFQTWEDHAHELAGDRRSLDGVYAKNKCTGCDVEPAGLDIQRAHHGKTAVRELVKYVGKSLSTSSGMMAFQPALLEFLDETWRRRMLSAFGRLLGCEKKEKSEPRCCEECGKALEFVTTTPVTDWTRAPPNGPALSEGGNP